MPAATVSPNRTEHDSRATLKAPAATPAATPPAAMTPNYADFIELFRRESEPLLVFFEQRLADPELATDLVAETFTAAIETRTSFGDSAGESLTQWLWGIGRETLTTYQQRVAEAGRQAPAPGQSLALGEQSVRGEPLVRRPSRRSLNADEVREIERLAGIDQLRHEALQKLNQLPAETRDPVRLRIVHQLPYEAVAARLKISTEQARVRVWRGLAQLVEQMHEGGSGQ
jgi:RNA polymerase sigma-70 factor (ECF subfamily)